MQIIHHNPFAASTSSSYENYQASIDKKYNKYNAFGQFISAALADLPDDKATDVMQRITMEIFAAQRDVHWIKLSFSFFSIYTNIDRFNWFKKLEK